MPIFASRFVVALLSAAASSVLLLVTVSDVPPSRAAFAVLIA